MIGGSSDGARRDRARAGRGPEGQPELGEGDREDGGLQAGLHRDALDQYLNLGKPRLRIFEEAGIDVGALGRDRVAAAFGNWLTKVKRGLPVGSPPGRPSPPPEMTEAERLGAENERLRMAVEVDRQL